ncbi:MAG: nucleotide sugar dehydrogenase [Phycisphaerales bacterium]|nr:nucleotide sugar dehydrogenase [Phycisphaerales bacterium]
MSTKNQPALSTPASSSTPAAQSATARALMQKIESKTAIIAIVGLGYVGLPLVRAIRDSGYPVIGFDVDQRKIDALNNGVRYILHLGDDFFSTLQADTQFTPTSDAKDLGKADLVVLCVPTPLGPHHEPDLTYVIESTKSTAASLRKGQLVVLESTTYPGTTRDEMKPILDARGMKCGDEYFLAYSPEREDPGTMGRSAQHIPKLVGGVDDVSTDLAMAFYTRVVKSAHRVSTAEIAESAKLLENIYRAVNIALVNEMKIVLTEMNIDVWEVVAAASTKPFGFQAFYPGPGLGGHCIPIDPYYLTWKAREVGRTTRFIELAGEVNTSMPHYVIERTQLALNDHTKPMKGSKILVLGIAYKKNIDDPRESPSAEIIELLRDHGAVVSYHDPHLATFPAMRKHRVNLSSVPLTPATLAASDCVLILTDHDVVDYSAIGQHAKLVVDTRNAMARVPANLMKCQLVKS